MTRSIPGRRWTAFASVAALATTVLVATGGPLRAQVVVKPRAGEVSAHVDGTAVLALPFAARHIALHWAGHPDASVTVATSADGLRFAPAADAGRDEVGEHRRDGETYGSILRADGAVAVRVSSDRPIGRLTVLALADGERVTTYSAAKPPAAGASVPQPAIRSRAAWGADESLRFRGPKEIWPPEFFGVQKLIVHHTAGQNADPDPLGTIRSIYYYHAVTQRWGDIGYNFLVDEAGHIYKGRHSHTTAKPSKASPSPDDTLTGEDGAGRVVTAGHAYGFNNGTVGVALLGTLVDRDATPAARGALADFLAWKADAHAIDPIGSSTYVHPVSGAATVFPNIAGHSDVSATECPGTVFYDTLPALRSEVAARIAAWAGSTTTSSPTTSTTGSPTTTTTKRKGRK